jgi:hypothetical protein
MRSSSAQKTLAKVHALPESRLVEEKGPWPFVTWRVFRSADGRQHTWSSRHHRKGLLIHAVAKAEGNASKLLCCLWSPRQLNWWIGTVFALGSLLFAVASILSLAPSLVRAWSLNEMAVNAVFFAGSIPFTTAAYLQLFQAANVAPFAGNESSPKQRRKFFGWRPHDIGWLSSALQFLGTILFNFNTFDAMIPGLTWFEQDLVIWIPDFAGSVLFLFSGYLAFIEACHEHWAWQPKSISWWVVFINLLGCGGFMVSAVFSIVLPGSPNLEIVTVATILTLQGAVCFLVGSLLMLPEMVAHVES